MRIDESVTKLVGRRRVFVSGREDGQRSPNSWAKRQIDTVITLRAITFDNHSMRRIDIRNLRQRVGTRQNWGHHREVSMKLRLKTAAALVSLVAWPAYAQPAPPAPSPLETLGAM